jgi:hypothetical protein
MRAWVLLAAAWIALDCALLAAWMLLRGSNDGR